MIKLHFYGGARMITGSNYLLEVNKTKILIDCGMFQGLPEIEAKNYEPFPYNPKEIDFVLITHSHLDHIGRLPKLIKEGFTGSIFATGPTIDFTKLMLEDSQRVLEEKAIKAGIMPPFDHFEIAKAMKLFQNVDYDEVFEPLPGIEVCFKEAGHILGSAIIEIKIKDQKLKIKNKETKIVFSGDLGNPPVPLLRPPAQIKEADYLIIESTYGDRKHESAEHCQETVEDVVEEVVTKAGTLLIPSFALERTQQILYHFNNLVEQHKIPRLPIFIDSPLALWITTIYKKYPQYYNKEASFLIKSGDDIFKFPGLYFTPTTRQSKKINDISPPKIIIAGSGMSQGGRILHHELRYLPDRKNTLLIVTYQAQGTLGRRILEGAKEIEILEQRIPVRAKIRYITGYSAHADVKDLINWVTQTKDTLKKVFVVQGEEKPALSLAQKIRDELAVEATIPLMGEEFVL